MGDKASRKSKSILLLLVALLVTIVSLVFILLHHEDGDDRVSFSLYDTNGNSVSENSLKGYWSVLIFGFTHCPDICPTQVYSVSKALQQLDPRSVKKVQGVFISVDYLRDTSSGLAGYLAHFDTRFRGFLGNKLQLDLTVDAFKANYSVTSNLSDNNSEDARIEVSHSSTIYLISPDAHIAKKLPFETNSEELVGAILKLISQQETAS